MNLVVDSGNTRFKVGVFDGSALVLKEYFVVPEELKEFMTKNSFDHVLVSSVNHDPQEILTWSSSKGKKIVLTSSLTFPISVSYATPDTLGVDRIAAACGAFELFPEQDCLVIDAGTCINYEFISRNKIYQGGGISPGIAMRFEAMHTFTSRLPLIKPINEIRLIGDSTESCMQSGVLNGVVAEVNGIIGEYKSLFTELRIILCGGDYSFFENRLKHPIFVTPDLVLIGLNRILRYHVEF
ncbi:MAG TPA: type III pantothenate kinase [Cyclobacteriaceae bacterium]|nr:type III pantothenate kinase [Cyclobacteriaceae bacterium]HPW61402.1 type III pantothenate kinase [Cyclobacteriaceae bacterium]